MKTCAYLIICLCLPSVLLAEDEKAEKEKQSPDENAAAVEDVADPAFERFKTILDRMPFGRPPPGFDPDEPGGPVEGRRGSAEAADAAMAEASEVEQQILSSVTVSMLNRTADGRVFVGFTDSSAQPAKNYLLELGEKREQCEWQVVSADPDNRQVTLSKGGVEATLKVGGGGGASDGKDKNAKEGGDKAKPGVRPVLARNQPLPASPDAGAGAKGDEEAKLTGLDIARARREARLAKMQAEAEQKRQADEQLKKEREQEKMEREQEKMEREQAAEERKAQLTQLMQIQEELRRQRAEKEERRAAAEEASQRGEEQPVEE